MKHPNPRVAAVALAAASALALAPAASAKPVAYTGTFSGTASVVQGDSSVTIKSVSGTGGAHGLTSLSGHNGTGTVSGSCAFFSGKATLVGSAGKVTLAVKSTSKGCGSGDAIAVSGRAIAKGTTGKVKKTSGTVTFSGTFNKSTGAFTVTLKGTV